MATRAKRGRPSRTGAARKRGARFAELPNFERMRRRSPESAPRLFEWLVDKGYIEPVSSYRRKSANRRARRR
jgi:hypothetical protein